MGVGIGLDLAGYTTGKSVLAFVQTNGRNVSAILLRDSAFSVKRKTGDRLDNILRDEVAALRVCLRVGAVAVDVPIDLQNLRNSDSARHVWELTLRPIDRKLGALPALADRIGASTARFSAVLRAGGFENELGHRLFEAYPAGTFKTLEIAAGSYKGLNGVEALASLCEALKIAPVMRNDDDLDAVICGITAAAPVDAVFEAAALDILPDELPRGFRIPRSLTFDRIDVTEMQFDDWAQDYRFMA